MRSEHKYVVPVCNLDGLRRSLSAYVTYDPYAARNSSRRYTIRSIYLDTPALTAYREKLDGVKVRRKYRIRGYDRPTESSRVFLEIKQKVDQVGCKYRCQIQFGRLRTFLDIRDVERFVIPEPCFEQAHANARLFLAGVERGMMTPAVLVVYDREAFVSRLDPRIRITFDSHLRCAPLPDISGLFEDTDLRPVGSGLAVVEIKFDGGYGSWLRAIVNAHGLVRTSVSKYASCIAASRDCAPLLSRSVVRDDTARIMGRTEVMVR